MKKQLQLGMNPSTASHKLVKDILWNLIQETGKDVCCKCKNKMERGNFSIEHIIPWLDSENPVELFFDLSNISFSHLKCNVAAVRRVKSAKCGTASMYSLGCRCNLCTEAHTIYAKTNYSKEARKEKYKRTGY